MTVHRDITDRYRTMAAQSIGWVVAECNVTDPTSPGHLMWMLNEIDVMHDVEKAMRWLGFVQGVLITRGLTTVNTERDFTRPYFKK